MIRCQALRWGAPGQPLTPPIDFELPKGSLTAVIGANGSGKSSLLKVIAGLQKPLAGKVDAGCSTQGRPFISPTATTPGPAISHQPPSLGGRRFLGQQAIARDTQSTP